MRARGVKAQSYHSFFRWSGQTEWTRESPRVIMWDEICTVPRPILKTFLDWLEHRGDHGQPPPITGDMPRDWLRQKADYYEDPQKQYPPPA